VHLRPCREPGRDWPPREALTIDLTKLSEHELVDLNETRFEWRWPRSSRPTSIRFSTLISCRQPHLCLPETQSACQFAHSPWDLNVRRAVNSLCRWKDADVAAREVENGDEIGRRRAGAAAASCLAVGVRRSCAPSRQRRQVFRPRAVRGDDEATDFRDRDDGSTIAGRRDGSRTHDRDRGAGSEAPRPTGTPRVVVGPSTPPSDVR
jgi:hypothetical protein